jgi:thymidylate synthase (FAD)
MIMGKGHESVIEHACASVRFVCDRGVSHELVRHRIASYSQESTRYCDYGSNRFGEEIAIIKPPGMTTDQHIEWSIAVKECETRYLRMIARGATPQIARSVLPNSLKTEIVTTANLREWRHIFAMRLSKAAHPQIREVMVDALYLLKTRCPNVFSDISDDGITTAEARMRIERDALRLELDNAKKEIERLTSAGKRTIG